MCVFSEIDSRLLKTKPETCVSKVVIIVKRKTITIDRGRETQPTLQPLLRERDI